MSENRFPHDPMQDLRDLQRVVDDNQAVKGSPLLEASAGWVLRNRSTPPVPDFGDVHIYAQDNRLWARSAYWTVPLITGPSVGDVTVTDAGSTYTTSTQTLINQMKAQLNALLASLRYAKDIDT